MVWSSSWSSSWTSRTTAWPPRVQAFMEKLREGIGETGCMVSVGHAHRGIMVSWYLPLLFHLHSWLVHSGVPMCTAPVP